MRFIHQNEFFRDVHDVTAECPFLRIILLSTMMIDCVQIRNIKCKKLHQAYYFKLRLTLIRESWKKIQNAGPSPSAFRGKKSRAQRCIICICSCALEFFFRKAHSVTVPKMAYIFVQHGIFPHILAYAI